MNMERLKEIQIYQEAKYKEDGILLSWSEH